MKKFISFITAAALLCGMSSVPASAASKVGDVNGDGAWNSLDASAILTMYAKTATGGKLTKEQKTLGDVNSDGEVNSIDASHILGYYAYKAIGGKSSFSAYMFCVKKGTYPSDYDNLVNNTPAKKALKSYKELILSLPKKMTYYDLLHGEYALVDMDKNGTTELILMMGESAITQIFVYTTDKNTGEVVFCGTTEYAISHTGDFYYNPKTRTVGNPTFSPSVEEGVIGYASVEETSLVNGKFSAGFGQSLKLTDVSEGAWDKIMASTGYTQKLESASFIYFKDSGSWSADGSYASAPDFTLLEKVFK